MPESDQEPTYRLTDGELLARLMRCPDKGGARHTVRSLSVATGISKSKISNMTRDEPTRPVSETQASLLAQAVGVRRKAIFMPITSVSADTDTPRDG